MVPAHPPRPSPDEFLAAFDQRIYGISRPTPVARNLRSGPGWGGSADEITHLRLSFQVGRRRRDVDIDNETVTRGPMTLSSVLANLVFREAMTLSSQLSRSSRCPW